MRRRGFSKRTESSGDSSIFESPVHSEISDHRAASSISTSWSPSSGKEEGHAEMPSTSSSPCEAPGLECGRKGGFQPPSRILNRDNQKALESQGFYEDNWKLHLQAHPELGCNGTSASSSISSQNYPRHSFHGHHGHHYPKVPGVYPPHPEPKRVSFPMAQRHSFDSDPQFFFGHDFGSDAYTSGRTSWQFNPRVAPLYGQRHMDNGPMDLDYDVIIRDYASPINLRLRGCYGNLSILLPENQEALYQQGYYDQDFSEANATPPPKGKGRDRASYLEKLHRKKTQMMSQMSRNEEESKLEEREEEKQEEDAATRRKLYHSSSSSWSRESSSLDESLDIVDAEPPSVSPPEWMVNVRRHSQHSGEQLWLCPLQNTQRRESGHSTALLSPPEIDGMDLLKKGTTQEATGITNSQLTPDSDHLDTRNLLSPKAANSSASSHEGTLTPRGSTETLMNSLDEIVTSLGAQDQMASDDPDMRPRSATVPLSAERSTDDHVDRRERRSSSLKSEAVDFPDEEADFRIFLNSDAKDFAFKTVEESDEVEADESEACEVESEITDSQDGLESIKFRFLTLPTLRIEEVETAEGSIDAEIWEESKLVEEHGMKSLSFRSDSSGFDEEPEDNFVSTFRLDLKKANENSLKPDGTPEPLIVIHPQNPNFLQSVTDDLNCYCPSDDDDGCNPKIQCCFCKMALRSSLLGLNLSAQMPHPSCAKFLISLLFQWKEVIISYQKELIQFHIDFLSSHQTHNPENCDSSDSSDSSLQALFMKVLKASTKTLSLIDRKQRRVFDIQDAGAPTSSSLAESCDISDGDIESNLDSNLVTYKPADICTTVNNTVDILETENLIERLLLQFQMYKTVLESSDGASTVSLF